MNRELLQDILINNLITREEFAKRIGVSYTTATAYLRGLRKPSLKAARRIKEEFHLTDEQTISLIK